MAGATRESVTVALQELLRAGRIRTRYKIISVHREEMAANRSRSAQL
ncbi:hypothetical protein [Paenibacillus xylanexedens]